jgi:hypothetical protein
LVDWKRRKSYFSAPGLPDGLFSNQKPKFGQILEGLTMEDISELYGHLVYFTDIWYILRLLWSFGIFFPVLVCRIKKNLATLDESHH